MECHKNGQPVLVGTVSVEKSETLAKMLQRHTRDFNVLNAKNHEREAEIVAQAGKKGAITIATDDVQAVDLGELGGFGAGSTGHTGQLFVHTEVVLEGDGVPQERPARAGGYCQRGKE